MSSKQITRSQWYRQKIEDFLESDEPHLSIDLYSCEVTRIKKRYPQLTVSIGDLVLSTETDRRHSCIIYKEDV